MKNKRRWSEAKVSNVANRHFQVQFVPYCFGHAKSFTTHLEVNFLCSKRLFRCLLCLVFSSTERLRLIELMGEHIRERTKRSSLQMLFALGQDGKRETCCQSLSERTAGRWAVWGQSSVWRCVAQFLWQCQHQIISSGHHCCWFWLPQNMWCHCSVSGWNSLTFCVLPLFLFRSSLKLSLHQIT